VPRLAGFDFDAFPGYTAEELNAGFFAYAALALFDSVDISATCNTDHATKTIYYGFPPDGFNGLQTLDDYSLECGAYGFYLGAEDLAAVPADLVAGDDLLSDPSFQLMKQGFLGFFNPLDGYPWGWGALGIYYNHGGDWYTDTHSKGLGTCVMVFPNGVSATLEINSIGGTYPYQCEVLRAAFDNAWVPN
jgi:hypothetical protein